MEIAFTIGFTIILAMLGITLCLVIAYLDIMLIQAIKRKVRYLKRKEND